MKVYNQKYYKIIYPDGGISLFESNNNNATDIYRRYAKENGGNFIEISKAEYKDLQNTIDNM
jgi:phosphosulfolactate synthase (CoM biosynthesis protein A)